MPELDHSAQLVAVSTLKPYKGNPRRGNVIVDRWERHTGQKAKLDA